jgi:AraC-like DNA-binding protein
MDPPESLADRPIRTPGATRGITSGPTPECEIAELRVPDTATVDSARDGFGLVSGTGQRDLLSELLANVRLNGDRIIPYAPSAGFSIGFEGTGALHIVEDGELELVLPVGERVERLRRGDAVLLPRGDPHRMRDAVGADVAVEKPPRWLSGTFRIGDSEASHLLAGLPEAIMLRGARDQALEGLDVARRMLLFEMERPSQGSVVMVARILDLLFIQILRASAAGRDGPPSWLAGALDPQLGPAVSAIHADPGHDWTVGQLAGLCNLSRSRFSERFTERVGKPPSTYLTLVRLGGAAKLLRDTSTPVGVIAHMVGYTSEPGFSRAFRAHYGSSPARWRRETPGRQSALD